MVGVLFRRLPTQEIPRTRAKSLMVIAALVVSLVAIGVVIV